MGDRATPSFGRSARFESQPVDSFSSAPDIASDVVPETTRFQLLSLDEDGHDQEAGELYEQRYLYDQLSPERLLDKAEGQKVTVVWWAGARKGRERSLTGKVVSSKEGVLLELEDGQVVPVDGRARYYFSALPPDLVVEPTLKWNVGSFEAVDATLKLSYRAERFAWRADYVVNLADDQGHGDVEGWVTVVNHGDTAFEQAKLQLVAGTVNTVQEMPIMAEAQLEVTNMYYQALDQAPGSGRKSRRASSLHRSTSHDLAGSFVEASAFRARSRRAPHTRSRDLRDARIR